MKTASVTQKWAFVCCVFLGFFFAACHLSPSTRSDIQESDQSIVSTGSASTFGQAEQEVWTDLKQRIHERLRGSPKKVIDQVTELALRDTHTSVSWFSSDKNQFVVTARVDIGSVLANLIASARQANGIYARQLEQAEQLLAEGSDGYGALSLVLKSFNNLKEIDQDLALIKALDPQSPLFAVTPSREELVHRVLSWLSEIRIQTAFGNDQHLSVGQSLAMPIGLWVLWTHEGKSVALAGLPVRFYLTGMVEKPLAIYTTNALGIASAHLSYVPEPGGALLAGIDVRGLLSEAGFPADESSFQDIKKNLETIQTSFQFHFQDSNVLRVVLFINETIAQQLQAFDQAESVKEFVAMLENEGYYLQVSSEPAGGYPSYTPEQLAAYFRSRADVIIVGRVDSEVERIIAEGLVFAQAKGKIELVNVPKGTVIGSFEDSSRGAGQDAYGAELRSIINFSEKAKPTIIKTLRIQSEYSATP
jgi:hypothetical protein